MSKKVSVSKMLSFLTGEFTTKVDLSDVKFIGYTESFVDPDFEEAPGQCDDLIILVDREQQLGNMYCEVYEEDGVPYRIPVIRDWLKKQGATVNYTYGPEWAREERVQ